MPLFRRAWPLVLAAALSVRAAAGVVTPAYAPVYAPPSGAWGAPLGAGLADASVMPLLPAGLNVPSLTTPEGLRAAAPLVQSLQKALSISPQAFAKMKPADKASAIELAVEDAREQARIKVYELVEEARVAASRPMDKEGRAALYAATARLMEVRTFYGPWLEEDASAAIEQSYTATSARAWEVRTSLLDSDLPDAAPAAKPKADAAPKKAYVLDPSSYALKLREDMKNNKSGWGQDDLHAIYTGFGFELRQGGKHRFYSHPAFPQLHDSVSRQNDLPPGYASSALKNIAELERLVAEQGKTAAAPATGPPGALTLDDFAILMSQPKEKPAKPRPVEAREARPVKPTRPVPARVEAKADPDPLPETTAVPAVTSLQPATERVVELKPEPPPAKTNPDTPGPLGRFVDNLRSLWRKD